MSRSLAGAASAVGLEKWKAPSMFDMLAGSPT